MECKRFEGPKGLKKFLEKCEKGLFSGEPYCFVFPEDCSFENWSIDKIKRLNKEFLEKLRNCGNVYGIFIRDRKPGSKWQKVYVGQRKSKDFRNRIREHFINKDRRTGSMLEKIKKTVLSGHEVGLSYIKVEPESLRLYVEAEIIQKYGKQLKWNTHR